MLAKPNLTTNLINKREENINRQQQQQEWGFVKNQHLQTSKQHQLQQNNQQNQRVRYQQVLFEYKLKFFQQQGLVKELGQYQTQQQRQQPLWQKLAVEIKRNELQLRQMKNQLWHLYAFRV